LIGTVAENFECEGIHERPWTLRSNNGEWYVSGSLFRSDNGIGSVVVFAIAIGVDPSELVRRGRCLVKCQFAEEKPDNEGQVSGIGGSVTIGITVHIARIQPTTAGGVGMVTSAGFSTNESHDVVYWTMNGVYSPWG
jgi:hypothetical protein